MNSLSASSLKMFLEISSIRKEFSERFQNHTNTVPFTFLWHWFCSTDHKTFSLSSTPLCPATVSRLQAFFSSAWRVKKTWERCETEDSNTVGKPNCLVFSFVVSEKSEKIVVRIVDEHRVIIHGSDLVDLFGLITCVCICSGQVAKHLDASAEWRMSCAF